MGARRHGERDAARRPQKQKSIKALSSPPFIQTMDAGPPHMPQNAAGAAPKQMTREEQLVELQKQQQQLQAQMMQSQQSMPGAAAVPPQQTNSPLNNLPIRAYLDQTVVPILLDGKCLIWGGSQSCIVIFFCCGGITSDRSFNPLLTFRYLFILSQSCVVILWGGITTTIIVLVLPYYVELISLYFSIFNSDV